MSASRFDDIAVRGEADFTGPVTFGSPILRKYLVQEDGTEFPIPLSEAVIVTTGQPLTATPSGSDCGLVAGTYTTGNLVISAGDVKGVTVTRYFRLTVVVPPEYQPGQPFKLRFAAGMLTTVAGTSCSLGCEAYKVGRNSLVSGGNLVLTAAQSINSLTFADKDFSIDPTALQPGDVLDVRLAFASVDAVNATAVKPTVAAIDRVCSIKG